MARAYSLDLRERLLQAGDAGLTPVEIERLLGISRRTQRRWVQHRAARGTVAPRQSSGRPCEIEVVLNAEEATTATDLLVDRAYEPIDADSLPVRMRMDGYGYRWIRLGGMY